MFEVVTDGAADDTVLERLVRGAITLIRPPFDADASVLPETCEMVVLGAMIFVTVWKSQHPKRSLEEYIRLHRDGPG